MEQRIKGTTGLLALIGSPVGHSGSPDMYNFCFRYHNLEPQDLLVIYDDVALPFGRMRLREKGSAGGQKGMISILESLGTQAIPRLRIGVDSPKENRDMAGWVLGNIPVSQRKYWSEIEDLAWKALTYWLANDIQKAMSYVNGLGGVGLIDAEKK